MIAISGGLRAVFKYVKMTSFFLLFTVIFINAIVLSVQQRSPYPILEDVGNKLVLVTQNLAIQSTKILETQKIYDFSSIKNTWKTLLSLSEYIVALWLCYAWIKVFGWLWNKTPFSFEGNAFASITLGTISFYVLQIIALLIAGTVTGTIHTSRDITVIALIPLQAVVLAFKAIGVILFPASNKLDSLLDISFDKALNSSIPI